jgi:hypothetical protein
MYRFIWNKLPGNFELKLVVSQVVVGCVLFALFKIVFPWLELSFFASPTLVEGP